MIIRPNSSIMRAIAPMYLHNIDTNIISLRWFNFFSSILMDFNYRYIFSKISTFVLSLTYLFISSLSYLFFISYATAWNLRSSSFFDCFSFIFLLLLHESYDHLELGHRTSPAPILQASAARGMNNNLGNTNIYLTIYSLIPYDIYIS